jgi:hypothetical protein
MPYDPHPAQRCLYCGARHNAAGDVPGLESPTRAPEPGDYIMCIRCTGISVVDENGAFRALTPRELIETSSDPDLQQMRFAILYTQARARHQQS